MWQEDSAIDIDTKHWVLCNSRWITTFLNLLTLIRCGGILHQYLCHASLSQLFSDALLLVRQAQTPDLEVPPDIEESRRWKKAYEIYHDVSTRGGIPSREIRSRPPWTTTKTANDHLSFHDDDTDISHTVDLELYMSTHWRQEGNWFRRDRELWRNFYRLYSHDDFCSSRVPLAEFVAYAGELCQKGSQQLKAMEQRQYIRASQLALYQRRLKGHHPHTNERIPNPNRPLRRSERIQRKQGRANITI